MSSKQKIPRAIAHGTQNLRGTTLFRGKTAARSAAAQRTRNRRIFATERYAKHIRRCNLCVFTARRYNVRQTPQTTHDLKPNTTRHCGCGPFNLKRFHLRRLGGDFGGLRTRRFQHAAACCCCTALCETKGSRTTPRHRRQNIRFIISVYHFRWLLSISFPACRQLYSKLKFQALHGLLNMRYCSPETVKPAWAGSDIAPNSLKPIYKSPAIFDGGAARRVFFQV